MLDNNALKNILHQQGLTQTDKLILCLAVGHGKPKTVKQIREIARAGGLGIAIKWNVSGLLSSSGGKAINTGEGWELNTEGASYASKLVGRFPQVVGHKVATSLRSDLAKIKEPVIAAFVDEAIRCFESKLYRAAVVLSWVGALAVLYQHVIIHRLHDFNIEAKRRDSRWKEAKTGDDLALMKESEFLNVVEAISVIGKSVKQELLKRLELRNGCGHPNSLSIGEHTVSAHIEALILNVFSRIAA